MKKTVISGGIFTVCGLWLLALGTYFLFMRPALLPEDLRYIGSSLDTIRSTVPGLERWLGHVFDVMGGFMVATGAMTMLVAWPLPATPKRGSFAALSVAGITGVALMSATNFALSSNYRWLLLAPALLWLAGLLWYVRKSDQKVQQVRAHRDAGRDEREQCLPTPPRRFDQ